MLSDLDLVENYFGFCMVSNEKCENNFDEYDGVKQSVFELETTAIHVSCKIEMKSTLKGQPQKEEKCYWCYNDC